MHTLMMLRREVVFLTSIQQHKKEVVRLSCHPTPEALLVGLHLAKALNAYPLQAHNDSQLMVSQY